MKISKTTAIVAIALLSALTLRVSAFSFSSDDSNASNQELIKQVKTLQKQVNSLQEQLNKLESNNTSQTDTTPAGMAKRLENLEDRFDALSATCCRY